MTTRRSRYYGYRFPPEIISHAVWLYHRFCLSFRDVEDLLAERCIIVTYETIRHLCQRIREQSERTGFTDRQDEFIASAALQGRARGDNNTPIGPYPSAKVS